MEVSFEDKTLARMDAEPGFNAGYDLAVARGFRKLMVLIRAALDERDFYAMRSLHYEKLRRELTGKHSMRINKQWRLILRVEQSQSGKLVVVVSILDYH